MSERNLRIRLGIFVVVTLLLLGLLILLFGSLPSLLVTRNYYTVIFDDAPGVNQGTPVRRSGVRIGEVTDVVLDDVNDKVRVKIAIDPKYTLRRSERPTIITGFLGNDTSIDFIPVEVKPGEQPDRTEIKPGAEIEGFRQVTVNTLLARASDVVPTTQEVLNDMRKSLKRFEDMAPLAEETMKEYRDLAKRTREAIPKLEATSDDVGATARAWTAFTERLNLLVAGNEDRIRTILENLSLISSRLNNLVNDENVRMANAIIKNVRDASDTFPATSRNILQASDEAPAIAKNLREASERFPSIAKNTDEGLVETRAFVKNFNESLTRADDVIRNLQKATTPLADRSDRITTNLDASLEKFNRGMTDINDLVRVVGQSDGLFKRVLTDPTLYNRLDELLCALNKSMPRVDRILRDLETFADKLARHPEAIGLGGVVHPGSGLKDPPAAPPVMTPSFSPKH